MANIGQGRVDFGRTPLEGKRRTCAPWFGADRSQTVRRGLDEMSQVQNKDKAGIEIQTFTIGQAYI